MKRTTVFTLILGILLLLLGGFILKNTLLKPAYAGLQVKSAPLSTVFLDGKNLGQTPFEEKKLPSGEVTLRLVPESPSGNLSSWETKIKLVSGTQTIVNREFGETEGTSAGEILTLEKIGDKKTASLAIVSYPDSSLVKIAGESKGFTPLSLEKLEAGEREIILAASGFRERTTKVRLISGFKLTLNIKLAEEKEVLPEPTPSLSPTPTGEKALKPTPKPTGPTPTIPPRPYVEIKETPTGWLRVRLEPAKTATEAAKVYPGEKYPFLEEESGWYKIRYEVAKEGWISGQYAEKFE